MWNSKPRSAAARPDRIVNIFDVGIEPAQFALTVRPALAQRRDRARLHHFEEIKPRRGAGLGAVCHLHARLQGRHGGVGVGQIAVTAGPFERRGAATVPAGAAISGTADGVVAGAPILCSTE